MPPTVDYLKEAEKFQKKMEANSRRQTADAQKQIEQIQRESQTESNRQQEIQNQIMQQGNDRLNNMAEQQNQNFNEFNKQQKATQELAAAQWKWIWLIPLFEILQAIGLGLIAFKYKIAKKSAVIMVAGLMMTSLVILLIFSLNGGILQPSGIQSPLLRLLAVCVGIISIYAFAVSKLSAYIIISLTPEGLAKKSLALFGIGISLTALYLLIDSITGHGAIGVLFGLGVIFIGGIIALVKRSKKRKRRSARFSTIRRQKRLQRI